MNFEFNFSNVEFDYQVEDIDYVYETEDALVLIDLNISKDKDSIVKIKIQNWLNYPTNNQAYKLFKGGYFIVFFDKNKNEISAYRDASGIKTGYFSLKGSNLLISTQLHSLAKYAGVESFNDKAVAMLLSLDFCFDGYTIYNGVNEFKMGTELKFKNALIKSEIITPVELADYENSFGYSANVVKLREEINRVHSEMAAANNVVYLSGGIDSCVMLGALHDVTDKSSINCISYKVKGTKQDETTYAKSIAKYLNVDLEVKEIDPLVNIDIDLFEETILKMNNPYIGYWIFAPKGNLKTTFFAGQDTRLHTPDVNEIDSYVFDLFIKNKSLPLGSISKRSFGYIHDKLNLKNSNIRVFKHLDRLATIGSPEDYLLKYIFKFKEQLKGTILEQEVNNLKAFYKLPKTVISKRHLYNEIVKIKWREQYTDDIRYMQDLARLSSTYIAVPFYDKELSEFSSSIPFEYASKFEYGRDAFLKAKVKVNKIILREAYKDKLNEDVLYRKKAVSVTNFLLFEGSVGKNVYQIIDNDLNANDSFIKHYGLEEFVSPFHYKKRDWHIEDQNYLMKIYYISTLCVYFKNISR